jgi:hypothetical protein
MAKSYDKRRVSNPERSPMTTLSVEDVMNDAKAAYERIKTHLEKINWVIPTQDMAYITNLAYKVSQEPKKKQKESLKAFSSVLREMVKHFNEAESNHEVKG